MFYVYAIKSLSKNYIYVGLTKNVIKRFHQHNKGWNKTTRPFAPYLLIYSEAFADRKLARVHEKQLKTSAGKRYLRSIASSL